MNDPEEGSRPVWTVIYKNYGSTLQYECGSWRDAVGFLWGGMENGLLAPVAIVQPSGVVIEGDDLDKTIWDFDEEMTAITDARKDTTKTAPSLSHPSAVIEVSHAEDNWRDEVVEVQDTFPEWTEELSQELLTAYRNALYPMGASGTHFLRSPDLGVKAVYDLLRARTLGTEI
jgi:predicted oxidoreductase (fatty acid repression mutant protein)